MSDPSAKKAKKASRKVKEREERIRSYWRRVIARLAAKLIQADVMPSTAPEPTKPEPPAVTYRAVSAREILKRVGEVKVYEEAGDHVMQLNPRGWHAEESFAYNKNKPTPVTKFNDVGKFGEDK